MGWYKQCNACIRKKNCNDYRQAKKTNAEIMTCGDFEEIKNEKKYRRRIS